MRRGLVAGSVNMTQIGPRGASDEMSTFVTSDSLTVWAANANNRTVAKLDPSTGRILNARRRSRERRDRRGLRRRLGSGA